MPKTIKEVSKNSMTTKKSTSTITVDDLNSTSFTFDEEMLYEPGSKWNEVQHWVADVRANAYKWYNSHPIAVYAFKRIFYGLITLLIAICVIALLVHSQVDPVIFLPPGSEKMGLTEEGLKQLQLARMVEFGYDTDPWKFLGNFLYNLLPFIPKEIVTSSQWEMKIINGEAIPVLTNEVKQTVWVYLGKTVRNDNAPEGSLVTDIFASAIPYSFGFGSLAVITAFALGIPLGIESAKRKGKTSDNVINGVSLFFAAVPALIITLGIYVWATSGFNTSSLFSSGSFWTKFFPYVTLVLFQMPPIVIMTRRYVIDEMTFDYTKFAYSQGFSTNKVYYVYIFRNAGIKIVRDFPQLFFATIVGSSMLVETQWGIPGMSSIVVSAANAIDPFVILGYVSLTAFIEIFASLMADLIVVGLDPRVSLGRK